MEELRSLADLLDLQAIDLDIDRLLHERQSLPELEEYRAAHGELTSREQALATAEAQLRATSLDLDKTEGELTLTAARLEAEQNRLFAGGMSARDADYLRREVEMIDRKRSEAEDRVLELMEQRERQDGAVAELQAEVTERRAAKESIEEGIKEAWSVIDAKLAKLETRKEAIVPLIDAELLELYDQLRGTKEGVAVGAMHDGICGGCHLKLTAAEANEARQSEPPRCIHCRRILVF
jgi:predicted  nucleic acid-binding Zn-ribbon protein